MLLHLKFLLYLFNFRGEKSHNLFIERHFYRGAEIIHEGKFLVNEEELAALPHNFCYPRIIG